MRYFIDTEFIEDGKTIDLISIGIVSEDLRRLYLESSEVNWRKASKWVRDNVKPYLSGVTVDRRTIAEEIIKFCDPNKYGPPEFWGYYADYDWVVLCQLFGKMIDLPKGWPMYCRDLKQLADDMGNPKLPKQSTIEHHALHDAAWILESWNFLNELR